MKSHYSTSQQTDLGGGAGDGEASGVAEASDASSLALVDPPACSPFAAASAAAAAAQAAPTSAASSAFAAAAAAAKQELDHPGKIQRLY